VNWNDEETAQCAKLAREIAAYAGPRQATPPAEAVALRLPDALPLQASLSLPRTGGLLVVRQLFDALRLDDARIFRWRMEHKLTQALLIECWCPGVVPVTRGLGRELAGSTRAEARRFVESLRDGDILIKSALGEASGELLRVDAIEAVLRLLAEDRDGLACPDDTCNERFVVQERIRVQREFRVHSLEDRVIPDLTFRRYAPHDTRLAERDAPNGFVQTVLDRLPAGLIKDTLYGWDVAEDNDGRWRVIEANPTGHHPVFKPGFQCSGFFQVPAWDAVLLARLCTFVRQRHGVRIAIHAASPEDGKEWSTYWWAAHCQSLLDLGTDEGIAPVAGDATDDHVPERIQPTGEAPERQLFTWALAECRQARGRVDRVGHSRAASAIQRSDLLPQRWRDWNRTARPYPAPTSVPALVDQHAMLRPEAIAVVSGADALSYGALRDWVNRLARHLRGIGVTSETRVAICMPPGIKRVVALLAIMKAGGAYLPLAAAEPEERRRYLLTHARVSLVVTSEAMREALSWGEVPVLCLDRDWVDLGRGSCADPGWVVQPESLAYIIYTSGSTGRPKAVAVTHASLTNVVCDVRDMIDADWTARWLAVTRLTFDIAALEIFLPLAAGMQVWVAAAEAGGAGLMRELTKSQATVMQTTPVIWQLLIEAGWRAHGAFHALSGGDVLPLPLARALIERGAVLWNLYGPTETTIWSSAALLDGARDNVPIGKPLANSTLYVMDDELRLQQPGAIGELYIGGAGLARGYADQPGLTAERFVADPYARETGGRLYRTGDLARWTGETIEFLGRTDSQVKIRGMRVECAELERVLAEHAGVRAVAVVPQRDSAGQTRLRAFIVGLSLDPASRASLLAQVKKRLPEHMVPSDIVPLAALPRTAHGKVDRRRLAIEPSPPSVSCAPRRMVPGTVTEARVMEIWASVLGREEFGPDEHFIDLGGHSLSAIQCLNRIRDMFDVELPLIAVFAHDSSARSLAALIDECRAAHADLAETPASLRQS
jgi:amino acid adenylation domain-containing protein